MTNRVTTVVFGAVIGVALMVGAAPVSAADYTMKIGLATFKDVQHQWSKWMKEGIEKRSGGRIEVKIFPKSQLGAVPRQIEGVQLGTQAAFVAPADFFAGIDPRFGAFSIPVLFKNKQQAASVLNDPEMNKEILSLGKNKGFEVVSVFTHSVAHYFGGKKPFRHLADFKGTKLRVNATAAEREKMRRFGASAIPMPLGEVVPAMQRGVIDGTMSGTVVYVVFKFNKLGSVLTRTDDTMIISTAAVSQAWLKRLPSDLRAIVIDEGHKLQKRSSTFSDANEKFMIGLWKKQGGELISLPPADLTKIQGLLADVGAQVTKGNPSLAAFYGKLVTTAKKY
ncbi:MAG: TRAP transporter substrate-binding protein [Rhodospirillales bacterium]|nr:TRAP transporter substrate-binding protein [Rhodospirillales bacterium]